MRPSADTRPPSRSVAVTAARYFAVVFGAGFALGMVRVPLLVPRLGERVAELLETPLMLAVIYFAARYLVRGSPSTMSGSGWIAVGVLALAMLLAAEVGVVVALQGRSVSEYLASRDPVSGSVYLASLAAYAAMPWLQSRWQTRTADGSGSRRPA